MNWIRVLSDPVRRGVRQNFRPGLVLQTFALLLVLGYFALPEVRALFDRVGVWKQQGGYAFSAISTAVFGGIIPFVVLASSGLIERKDAPRVLSFYVAFWVWKGIEVDALYRTQALWFGDDNDAKTIFMKVVVDQFVYNPLWGAPTQALCFLWKDSGFSFRRTRELLREQALALRSVIVLVSTWVVWVPAVAIIYSLPQTLQIPLFNLVLCFWSLLLSFVSRQPAAQLS